MDDATYVRNRMEINDLLNSYAHSFDSSNLDAYYDLFTEDARIDVGAGEGDKAAMIEVISAGSAALAGTETRHFITNVTVDELSDASASGMAYFLYTETVGQTLSPGMTGSYTFKLVRENGRWRICQWVACSDRS